MINHHSRRIFTVGSQSRGCDFTTLTTAFAALAALGGWTVTNRALLIVESVTNEPTNVTPQSFIDVHFLSGASLNVGLNISVANYDASWSAESSGSTHIAGLINITASVNAFNLYKLNVTNAAGASFVANFGAASATVVNVNAIECSFTGTTGNSFFGFGLGIKFLVTRCSITSTSGVMNLACGAEVSYTTVTNTLDATGTSHFIQPLAGSVVTIDFCNITGGNTSAGFGVVTFTQNASGGKTFLRNSVINVNLPSTSVLWWQTGAVANFRILNNSVIAATSVANVVNATVATPNIRACNNAFRGVAQPNWGNLALAVNGSNIVVT